MTIRWHNALRLPSNWTTREWVAAVLARSQTGYDVEEHGDYSDDDLDRAEKILDDELAPTLLAALLREMYTCPDGLDELRAAIDAGQDQGYAEGALPGTNHGRLVLARFLTAAGYTHVPPPPNHPEGPDDGHTFRITMSSRGSYDVVGDPHHSDSPVFGPETSVDVRAWNLRDALHRAAEMPLATLLNLGTSGDG